MSKTSFYYYYTVEEATCPSKRPFHLDLRFPSGKTTLEQAQVKREHLLTERRFKLHQRFIQVQRTVQQVKAKKQQQASLFLQSLENAERNRIDQLEQRRAINKQLVDRAKSIAHQHRSQTKAERERRRLELERRLEASEIRRLNYLGLSKSTMASRMSHSTPSSPSVTSMTASSSSPSSSPSSASHRHIQQQQQQEQHHHHHHHHHYHYPAKRPRRHSLATLLHSFHHLGLPISTQQETWLGFHALGRLIRQHNVISITSKVLNIALDYQDKRCNKSRVFLSAYMMVMCPEDILQTNPQDEQDLMDAAKQLLERFETWMDHPLRCQAKMAFAEAWYHYHSLFDQWKSKDRDQLLTSMIAYYLELVSVQHTILPKDQANATSMMHENENDNGDEKEESEQVSDLLTQQMDQLKSRIEQLGGVDAVNSLMEQVNALHLTWQDEEEEERRKGQRGQRQQEEEEVRQVQGNAGIGNTSVSTMDHSHNDRALSLDDMPPMDQLMEGLPRGPLLTNAQLAHELILDPDFQLQTVDHHHQHQQHVSSSSTAVDLEDRVRAMALQAYFDVIRQDIEHGQYKTSVLPLIEEIRKKLLNMVEEGKPAYDMMSQVIDISLMQQQIDHGSLDLKAVITTILACQAQLCAPSRDATVAAIQERSQEPGWQLEQIMSLLDEMALDLANFRLRSLRPYLAPLAVSYEQEQFCTLYSLNMPDDHAATISNRNGNSNSNTSINRKLAHTYGWLAHAFEKWQRKALERNPEHVHLRKNNQLSSPKELVYDALLAWITEASSTTTWSLASMTQQQTIPETWQLDVHRLTMFHQECQRLITVASLLMVAKNVGKVTSNATLSTLAQTLLTLLSTADSSQQHITAEMLRVTPAASSHQQQQQHGNGNGNGNGNGHVAQLMSSMVQRILSHNDTVYALLGRRVASVLRSQWTSHQFVSDAVLVSSSLEFVKVPLQQLAMRTDTLCHHHLKVYLPWYSQCLAHLQAEQSATSVTSSSA